MSSSLRATGILRCKPKIAKSGHSNTVTIVMMIMVHVCQINCGPMSIKLRVTYLDHHEGSDTHKPALQNFSQYGTIQ